ncbi:MAG: DUF4040 domain-containing protein [Burkholderiales bacterium]|nr:DUF4040 domain-containing protein [Burkholderiales bacterium]MBK8666096.1 DUF4040 domain-containing protein [Burkholderiales bacterium]
MIATLVLVSLAAGVLAPIVVSLRAAPWLALLPAALFAAFANYLPEIAAGGVVLERHAWIPSLGVYLSFRLDGLSLLFALLITGIGTFIFLYAASYLHGDDRRPRFFAFLTLFMGLMLGAVLADDLMAMLVFWELTSVASFLLIGYSSEQALSRRAAQQGLLMTVAGGLALLAGIILLGSAAGSLRFGDLLAQATTLRAHPLAPAIIVLMALGAFAKSAQVPLHAWLANAMVAPTPVSAFLHSATMVKLGVYLLARFNPVFGEHGLWSQLLVPVGVVTMLTAALLALRETDLKRLLAYSTVASLGTLVALIGVPHPLAATAAVTVLLAHALYKASLFMVAGIVDHATGVRDATRLGALARAMPLTALAAVLAGLSMAGLPPFVGFIGKELLYEVTLAESALLVVLALLASTVMVVIAGVVAWRVFFGPPRLLDATPHDPGPALWLGPLVLALLGLLGGLWPQGPAMLLQPAASAIAGLPVAADLALWHGFTPMLALSVLTLLLGVLLLRFWLPLRHALAGAGELGRWGPDVGYDRLLAGLQRTAVWQTGRLQNGSLRRYVGVVCAISATAVVLTLWLRRGWAVAWPSWGDVGPEALLPALLVLAAWAVLRAASFMAGIVAAGMVGFLIALTFLFRGAPDLAFTQFSVEALAIVILLAIVGRMPFHQKDPRSTAERRADAFTAAALGVAASLVLMAVVATPFDSRLSDYFRVSSVPEAHGRNLVNVIIVDFRALDTLGEITVLSLAALAAAAVIASVRTRRKAEA